MPRLTYVGPFRDGVEIPALAISAARGVPFDERAIRETPPTLTELRTMLAAYDGNLRKLFNSSGIEYRALKLAEKVFIGFGGH